MYEFFRFEADFVDSLRCIPMVVRYKLDTCGIKLKLPDWHQLSNSDRQTLVETSCHTLEEVQNYRTQIQQLILNLNGKPASELAIEPHPEWLDTENIPTTVQTKAAELNLVITPQQWAKLTPLQRFALIKLSRSGHENNNFPNAIAEFQIKISN